MPLKEYRCRDCGTEFETWDADPACPECTKVDAERVFLTPPGVKSKETSFKDHVTKDLAQSYGLSDLNNKYGEPVINAVKGQRGPDPAHAHWGQNAQMFQKASKAPPTIVEGAGFSQPKPIWAGKVKE